MDYKSRATTLFYIGLLTFAFLSLLPPSASAFTSQCTFESWNGSIERCIDADLSKAIYPYKVTETTYQGTPIYKVRSDDTFLYFVRKPSKVTHTFNPYHISTLMNFDSKADLVTNSGKHNNTVRYLNVTKIAGTYTKTQDGISTGPFFNDYNVRIYDSSMTPLTYNGVYLWDIKGTDLLLYIQEDDQFWNNANYTNGVFISFDSWTLNSTNQWNGTHDQTSLSIIDNVVLERDYSPFSPSGIYTMDNFNATHILDDSGNNVNCVIVGMTDAVGQQNRSRQSTADYLNCSSPNREYDFTDEDFTFAFLIFDDNSPNAVLFSNEIFRNSGYGLFYGSGGRLDFRTSQGAASQTTACGIQTTKNDEWTSIVISRNGGTVSIYNGTDECSYTAQPAHTDPVTTQRNLLILAGHQQVPGFVGAIDEFIFINGTAWTQGQAIKYFDDIYHSDGNFTTDNRNTNGTNYLSNVSATFDLNGSSSVNLYLNNTATNEVELLCTGCTTNTNYTPVAITMNYSIIVNLVNGSTPHLFSITGHEGDAPPDVTAPNITSMLPANLSKISQEGNTVNVPFSATCTDNGECDNATLEIWNSTFDPVTIQDIHFATYFDLLNGTGTSGALGDTHQDNGSYFIVQERGGGGSTECLDIRFNITSVPLAHDHKIKIDTRYNGGGGHIIFWNWKNISNGQWVSFANQTQSAVDEEFISGLIPSDDSVQSGNFTIQAIHSEGGSACSAAHLLSVDLLEIEGDNNIFDFVDGDLNTTIELTDFGQSPYLYIFTAVDTSGNIADFHLGNYTFFVNATPPLASNIIIIQPTNKTYTAINDIPYRGYIINELELDTIWYSLNGGNNTTFTFNTTLFNLDTNSYILITYINRTNGKENSTTTWFTVDYDGFGIEPEGLGGEFMETTVFILFNVIAFSLAAITILVVPKTGNGRTFTSLLSMVVFFGLALWSQDLSHFTGGTSISYDIAGLLWFYAGLGFIMFIYALVNFLFMVVDPTDDPYGGDVTDGGYGIFENEGFISPGKEKRR